MANWLKPSYKGREIQDIFTISLLLLTYNLFDSQSLSALSNHYFITNVCNVFILFLITALVITTIFTDRQF